MSEYLSRSAFPLVDKSSASPMKKSPKRIPVSKIPESAKVMTGGASTIVMPKRTLLTLIPARST